MRFVKECPICHQLYYMTKTCNGGDKACHAPTETIEIKERRLDLEKGIMMNTRGEHNGA